MARSINVMGLVGTGVMGSGIAQVAAQAGVEVRLYDAREGAAVTARDNLAAALGKLVAKGKVNESAADAAIRLLQPVAAIEELAECDMVVEAIVESLDAKRSLLTQLEGIVDVECILATNTSSLSVSAIATACDYPQRVAGFHFFNPVPLMKIVEIVDGIATDPAVSDALLDLASRMGHLGVRAKDTPGFIVNHAGRAYITEALKILGEGVALQGDVDRILREGAGFRMGPLELLDLTALDVSHPVMESIYTQFYHDPRYTPSSLTRRMLMAGHIGRKAGQGFYRYQNGQMIDPPQPQPVPCVEQMPTVWVGTEYAEDQKKLVELLNALGAQVEEGDHPSEQALCLIAPYGEDATTASERYGVDAARTVCLDLLIDLSRHRTLMMTPATLPEMRNAAHGLLARDGVGVTVIRDSVGFVAQRVLAMVVNLACDIAQQRIASPDDIDQAVRLGLGYPQGPLTWGDSLNQQRLLIILERMMKLTGDPRYRPSPWLRRRARLGLSLCLDEPSTV